MTTKEYMIGIITGNPVEKLLPMTHRNNHGITLDTWQIVFAEQGIDTKQEQYTHTTYSLDGKNCELKQQLIPA